MELENFWQGVFISAMTISSNISELARNRLFLIGKLTTKNVKTQKSPSKTEAHTFFFFLISRSTYIFKKIK